MLRFAEMHFLKILTDNINKPKLLTILLKNAKNKDLQIVFELVKNILENNVSISEKQKQDLRTYESKLIFLSVKKKNFKNKLEILLKNKFLFKLLLTIAKEFLIDQFYSEDISESESEISEIDNVDN
jgi:hypothetical protein